MWLLNPYWYTRQYSAPVSNYLDQVIAADVAAGNLLGLEDGTKTAIATFIDNLIVDGYLGVTGGTISQASSVIKASPILAGARTLAGALVPLVGTAPTNFNFGAGDYNRKTGLMGNGTTTYLNSNRLASSDPQNSAHVAVYQSTQDARNSSRWAIGTYSVFSSKGLATTPTAVYGIVNEDSLFNVSDAAPVLGLWGASRSSASSTVLRYNGANYSSAISSTAPSDNIIMVFARSGAPGTGATATEFSSARIPFYSIGESLDLALLDARVTTLINAIAAAIP